MNERIEKLAEQTGMVVDKYGLARDAKNGLEDGVDIYKFAELIVRECAELCSTHEMADEPFGEKSYRKGRHFSTILKQHFGVE